MNTATITQAQNKGLRHQFADVVAKVRDFAIEMYTAHGGWFVIDAAQPASGALARTYDNYAPTLAANLRRIDAKK